MPELPQMQALAERLDDALRGREFESYQLLAFAALKTVAPAPESLIGRVVERVGRRGKYLVFELGSDIRMLLHLSQSGRVDLEDTPKTTRGPGGVVRFRFVDGPAIFLREFGRERRAAWWVLGPGEDGPLAGLGPEPDSEECARLVRTSDDRRRIHTLLRDQHTVAGIGRGYADDIMWRAQLSPYATLRSLDGAAREALLSAIRSVLDDGLIRERARTGGLSEPKLGGNFEIHTRVGTPCPRCSDALHRVSYESYEVAYCPQCQTAGKVLADRRLSRLIK